MQALRAALQVTQQKLEGMGLVFASSVVHNSSAQAWVATGPLSMGRQVVAMVNQQLTVGSLPACIKHMIPCFVADTHRW